jgi:hypothetical protein
MPNFLSSYALPFLGKSHLEALDWTQFRPQPVNVTERPFEHRLFGFEAARILTHGNPRWYRVGSLYFAG